ncbi:hypothetical protein [Mycolicibacterium sp. P9-22]|uniref:hypothetical protein n=1 Tax=Mycolicibacterium sp. P9-22 TaxID=2024613 RepID=UPI0011ED57BD|nr:hypothetical protein [Mycolicibacterium sp. P9-22]KAA0115895.1 hypothetical protein CIW51_15015 [Mycolicibacterium sp. P9-22]
MRLAILDHGHRRRAKVFLALAGLRGGTPDIVKMLLYRPGFLTRPLLALTVPVMRGPSFWSAGEREFLAMSTAQTLQCPFCIDTHAELTRIASGGAIDPDGSTSIRPELAAVRDFLATLDGSPNAPPVAGLPEPAVLEALRVALVFNIIGRLANAFGFVLREGQAENGARALHRVGYRFPGFLIAGGPDTGGGDAIGRLRHSVLDGPGSTDPALRSAAASGAPMPEPWESFTARVRDASYTIGAAEIDHLLAAGNTEDDIFEATVAAATGAAIRAFDLGCSSLAR